MNARFAGGMAGALLALLTCSSPTVAGDSGTSKRVQVVVADLKTHTRLPDARVFVWSEDGRVLLDTKTDALGEATFDPPPADSKPRYLLVERERYFLMGRDWLPGQLEYYMPLVGLTPPGLY